MTNPLMVGYSFYSPAWLWPAGMHQSKGRGIPDQFFMGCRPSI